MIGRLLVVIAFLVLVIYGQHQKIKRLEARSGYVEELRDERESDRQVQDADSFVVPDRWLLRNGGE